MDRRGNARKDLSPMDMLRSGIALAEGGCAPTTGYAVGGSGARRRTPCVQGTIPSRHPQKPRRRLLLSTKG